MRVLIQIERVTGRKIVDLFDWIIGTSGGALIALALIYGQSLSLPLLFPLYPSSLPFVCHPLVPLIVYFSYNLYYPYNPLYGVIGNIIAFHW